MALVNRDALDMLTKMREEVTGVVRWQQAILGRMEQLSPKLNEATMIDFTPDAMMQVDELSFRFFVEASIAKLTPLTQ